MAAAAALALVMLVPTAAAHHGPGDLVVQDPSGDTTADPGVAAFPDVGRHDLRSIWVGHESEEDVAVGWRFVATDERILPNLGAGDRTLDFEWSVDGSDYWVYGVTGRESPCSAELQIRHAGQDSWTTMDDCLSVDDLGADGIKVTIPRSLLVDRFGAVPIMGDQMRNLTGKSSGYVGLDSVSDTAGPSQDVFAFASGAVANQSIRLWSPTPIRMSNGEATTIIYDVEVRNLRQSPVTLALASHTNEDGFIIEVPDTVHVPAAGVARVPAVLVLGSAHRHGDIGQFEIVASDQQEKASMTLGVEWLEVAQPTGHHPYVYLHARETPGAPGEASRWTTWMNTLESDEERGANADAVPSQRPSSITVGRLGTGWSFPLDPSPVVGFAMEANGSRDVELDVEFPFAVQGAMLELSLNHYCSGCGEPIGIRVLASGTSAALDAIPGQTVTFPIELAVAEGVDVSPYALGATLGLEAYLSWEPGVPATEAAAPRLTTSGARVDLPLRAYHDALTTRFESGSLLLTAQGPTLREANPGGRVVVPFEVRSESNDAADADAWVVSDHREAFTLSWASKRLDSDGSPLELAVNVPPGTAPGSRIDGVLIVASSNDAANSAAVVVSVLVVGADQRVIADDPFHAESPRAATPWPLASLIVLIVVAARRR